jgi:dsRNA-specific ribonuclease
VGKSKKAAESEAAIAALKKLRAGTETKETGPGNP